MRCTILCLDFLSLREKDVDIFSKEFQSILNEITPQMLPQFETNTIQLLLEICYSYLTQESNQYELECSFPITLRELGMNILDSLILFALNTDCHPENGDIRCAS